MADAIQAVEDASPEVREILKELEAEGKGEIPKPETPVETDDQTKAKAEADAKTEAEAKAAEAAKADPEAKPRPPEREQRFVPVAKHAEERHKRQEAEAKAAESEAKVAELQRQLAGLSGKPTNAETDDVKEAAKTLAMKHGVEEGFAIEFAETIVAAARKGNVVPRELEEALSKMKQAEAQANAAKLEIEQEKHFDDEFSAVSKEFPDLADRKEELKRLAFSEGNVNVALRRLALEYIHDNPPPKPGRKTAESPSSGDRAAMGEAVDFESMTEEQFKNLTEAQYVLWEKWVEKKR